MQKLSPEKLTLIVKLLPLAILIVRGTLIIIVLSLTVKNMSDEQLHTVLQTLIDLSEEP